MRLKRIGFMLLGLMVCCQSHQSKAQFISIGPQLHYYFSRTNSRLAGGFELAFNYLVKIQPEMNMVGIDFGVEFGKTKVIYSEVQAFGFNRFLIGVSTGIYRKYQLNKEPVNGFQVSGWGGLFLLPDFRYRNDKSGDEFGVGSFLKWPIPTKLDIY